MSKVFGTALSLLMVLMMMSFLGCEGDQGPQGPQGAQGVNGTDGRDASTDPPGDMIFGLAIANNSYYNYNGVATVTLTFDQSAEPSENVVVCKKLDKPPVIDGQDRGIEDWGSDEFTVSSVPLENLRGVDNRITFADLRAGYDDKYIYMLVSWVENQDEANGVFINGDFQPGKWSYDRPLTIWERKAMTEDNFMLFWDISGVSGWNDNGADLLFHDGDSSIYLDGGGLVDVWHFKAGRTGLLGHFDDEYVSTGLIADQGTAAYADNALDELPAFMRRDDPNSQGGEPWLSSWDAVPFDETANWNNDASIPGFVSVMPTGSRADIECSPSKDSWKPGEGDRWVVEFRRLRQTGNGDDVKF